MQLNKSRLNLFDFAKITRGINKYIALLICLAGCIELFGLANPLFMQYIIDYGFNAMELNNLYVIAAACILLICLQVLTEFLKANLVLNLSTSLTKQIAALLFSHLLQLPLNFFARTHKGDLQAKFQAIEHIQKKISVDFVNASLDSIMIVINFGIMLIYNATLTILVVCSIACSIIVRLISYHYLKKQTEIAISHRAHATSAFLETLSGILPIKIFRKEAMRFNIWQGNYTRALDAEIKISQINVMYNTTNQLLFYLEPIVLVCVSAKYILAHVFSYGMLIAFLTYRTLLTHKAAALMQNIVDYKLISIHVQRLSDILLHPPEVISEGVGCKKQMQGSLILRNISFRYDNSSNYVLHNIYLAIAAGEKVVITGPSGCGKSTLLKIMMALYHPTNGEILIDGLALQYFGLQNYRNLIAAVMQEDSLLSGSIIDNIAFFDAERDWENILWATKLACIHEDIDKLPQGYETLIGDMGTNLSGGQKQRLLLARALYKKPKILFLDEATSHLDVAHEKMINNFLKSLAITQIVIAHRLETIQMADRVITLAQVH